MASPAHKRNISVGRYRSGLEDKVSAQLGAKGIQFRYEELYVPYTIPESKHKYTPDFVLANGIIIETKGIFDVDDRKKHLLIKQQHPELDIRIVFSSSRSKLYKGSNTTYASWCEKNGIMYADKLIPVEWLKERPKALPGILKEKGAKKK